MDYTRMTQNCAIEGWWSVDGQRHEFAEGARGTRDRSWGIRPVGLADPQPAPRVRMPQFFWQWTPLNFADRSIFFHRNADGDGTPWNTRAVVVPDGRAGGKPIEIDEPVMETTLAPGSRWPDTSTLVLPRGAGEGRYQLKPVARFQMRGLGYTSPDWGHGHYKGRLEVAREDFALAECGPGRTVEPACPDAEPRHRSRWRGRVRRFRAARDRAVRADGVLRDWPTRRHDQL